ncbi:MAG: hypothetical protein PWP56_2032 [Acetobacterium sp.]|nr:hypothetical protein [Acetobacterium sp.]
MNSEKLIKDKLTNLAREYQIKRDAEINVIEEKWKMFLLFIQMKLMKKSIG